jgi:hypothetical protein
MPGEAVATLARFGGGMGNPCSVVRAPSSYVNLVHSQRQVVEVGGGGLLVYIGSCGWFWGVYRFGVIPAK